MESKNNNLELWNKVALTDRIYTKDANVKGNKITSINPQSQIKKATDEFGAYGKEWGFRSLDFSYDLISTGLITLKAVFYYPNGEFPIVNSASLFIDNAKTKVDSQFAKKIETDTLTKALSKLGFNADIFLGQFNNQKEIAKMMLDAPIEETETTSDKIANCTDLNILKLIWMSLKEKEQGEFAALFTEKKKQLNTK